jgi:hypothetical protein
LRPTVSRPVCFGVRRPSGTHDQLLFLLEISFRQLRVCYFVAPFLTRGRVCNLLYNCFWALPEQSLLGPSFHSKKFKICSFAPKGTDTMTNWPKDRRLQYNLNLNLNRKSVSKMTSRCQTSGRNCDPVPTECS